VGPRSLADQQLAGVIMWVPAGLVYLAAGLTLVLAWLRQVDREEFAV
jgi:putative membrane protein